MKAGQVMYEPSAKGVNKHIAHIPAYIGWRMMQ